MACRFNHRLQFLAGVKRHDAPRRDRNLFARLRIATGPLWFLAQLKVAEARELDAVSTLERRSDFLEKALDHVLGFALVETELLEQQVGQDRKSTRLNS